MSSAFSLRIALIAAALLGGQRVSGQAPNPGATTPALQMHLNLTLTKAATSSLQQADVRLLDNGSPIPTQSLQPAQSSGQPTHVILVIDDVNARLTTVAYERDQLKKFFTRNDGRLSAPFGIAVMTDTKTEIQQGFSQSGIAENNTLQNYKIGLHEIRRDSQYGGFDRTDIGVKALLQLVQYASTIPGHKLILFVSPGWPLLSGPRIQLSSRDQTGIFQTVAQLQNDLLRSNTTIDMVNPFGPAENLVRSDYYQSFLKGVRKPGDVDIADLSLQVIAAHSGGTVQQGTSDITGMVDRSITELDHTYTLTFQPAAGEDRTTLQRLQVDGVRTGSDLRTPDEYYDVPAAPGNER